MKRLAILSYGVISYLMFLAVFAYAMGFMANAFVPKSIDSGATPLLGVAVLVNTLLLLLFGLQHSVMARPGFKSWWKKFVPESMERSTYVLASNLCLIVLFIFWQPMPDLIWDVQQPVARIVLWSIFVIGWLSIPAVTLLINHFDLFGLRQSWLAYRNQPYTYLKFGTPGVYKFIRHPLYVGWFLAFWVTPTMSAGHLLFAAGTTAYILIAIQFEERDLMKYHGEYAAYRQRTGRFLPRLFPGATQEQPELAQHAPVRR